MYKGADIEQKRYEALHGAFSYRMHGELFKNYLEVVISPEGEVMYAVPSHQLKLMEILMEKNHWTREQLDEAVPQEFYCNMMEWLYQETGYIAVWNDNFGGHPTKEQTLSLRRLTANGYYCGPCYPKPKTWYCVVTTVTDKGEVHSNIVDTVESVEKPEGKATSARGKDVYVDWYGSLHEALCAMDESKKA